MKEKSLNENDISKIFDFSQEEKLGPKPKYLVYELISGFNDFIFSNNEIDLSAFPKIGEDKEFWIDEDNIFVDGEVNSTIVLEDGVVKIFNRELFTVLNNDKLKVIDLSNYNKTDIDGMTYLNTYSEAFNIGERYFRSNHMPSDTILFNNPNECINKLEQKFNSNGIKLGLSKRGWKSIRTMNGSLLISHKIIACYGFYTGVLNAYFEFKDEYKFLYPKDSIIIFKNDDKINEMSIEQLISRKDINYELLFQELTEKETPFFDPNSDRTSFLYAFGAIDSIDNYIPLRWIKKQKRNKQVSISAFLDLLNLLNIEYIHLNVRNTISNLFTINKEDKIIPFKIAPKHYSNKMRNKGSSRKKSEFYSDLETILKAIELK